MRTVEHHNIGTHVLMLAYMYISIRVEYCAASRTCTYALAAGREVVGAQQKVVCAIVARIVARIVAAAHHRQAARFDTVERGHQNENKSAAIKTGTAQ